MRFLLGLLFFGASLAGCPFGAKGTKPVEHPSLLANDILQQLDDLTTSIYSQNVDQLIHYYLQRGLPVIYAEDSIDLYLNVADLKSSTPTASTPVHQAYTQFKLCSHPTLTLYSLLQPTIASSPTTYGSWLINSTIQTAQLGSYLPLLQNAVQQQAWNDPTRNFNSDQKNRCQVLLNTTLALMQQLNETQLISPLQLNSFVEVVVPNIKSFIHDGARATLDLTNSIMQQWRKQYLNTAELWDTVVVLVPGGSHMARVGQLQMQYFSWLLQVGVETYFVALNVFWSSWRMV